MISMVHWATWTLGQCIFKDHHGHLQWEANGEGGNGSLKLWLPSWLHWHMASAKASASPSGVFLAPFLLALPDSVTCSMRRLPVRSSAAADGAHHAVTTTWESHWNAESPQTCDCMIPGKRIPNSCKYVVSTPGHVLRNWRSHTCFLRLCLFSFHPVPHFRETIEAVEAGFNHSELSVRSWAQYFSSSVHSSLWFHQDHSSLQPQPG